MPASSTPRPTRASNGSDGVPAPGGDAPGVVDDRRPRSLYGRGEEPDPRFTLANERTLLAWLRTALALVATGVGLVLLSDHLRVVSTSLTLAVAIASAATGGVTAVVALRHWRAVELALRLKRPLPAPSAAGVVVLAVVTLALVALVSAVVVLA
jgi:putative membrane protein